MTDVFATPHEGHAHEQIVFCSHERSGLRAIIALYSTALGPGLGGTRFYPYGSTDDALADVMNLSRAMAYKNALAGLDHGGGKAVIIGDPDTDKSEALLRAYGRFVQSLGGRYITACDVGTYCEDMDVIHHECGYVTGRTEAHGGAGDSSILTAYGVYQGMCAAAEHVWGTSALAGRRVGVEGVGKVGRRLVEHLRDSGADVVICDVDPRAVERVRERHPEVEVVDDAATLKRTRVDIFAPCALGGSIDDETAAVLTAKVVCGAANNQLAHPGIDKQLAAHGTVYAPDYAVNSGGVVQVADEIEGFDFERAKAKAAGIFDTMRRIFRLAAEEGIPEVVAADRVAERRMSEIGELGTVWLDPRHRHGVPSRA